MPEPPLSACGACFVASWSFGLVKPLLARDVFDAECGCSETPRRLWAFAWVKFIEMLDIVFIVAFSSHGALYHF